MTNMARAYAWYNEACHRARNMYAKADRLTLDAMNMDLDDPTAEAMERRAFMLKRVANAAADSAARRYQALEDTAGERTLP